MIPASLTQGFLTAMIAGNLPPRRAWEALSRLGVTETDVAAALQVFPRNHRSAVRMALWMHAKVVLPRQVNMPLRSTQQVRPMITGRRGGPPPGPRPRRQLAEAA